MTKLLKSYVFSSVILFDNTKLTELYNDWFTRSVLGDSSFFHFLFDGQNVFDLLILLLGRIVIQIYILIKINMFVLHRLVESQFIFTIKLRLNFTFVSLRCFWAFITWASIGVASIKFVSFLLLKVWLQQLCGIIVFFKWCNILVWVLAGIVIIFKVVFSLAMPTDVAFSQFMDFLLYLKND